MVVGLLDYFDLLVLLTLGVGCCLLYYVCLRICCSLHKLCLLLASWVVFVDWLYLSLDVFWVLLVCSLFVIVFCTLFSNCYCLLIAQMCG